MTKNERILFECLLLFAKFMYIKSDRTTYIKTDMMTSVNSLKY